MPMGRSVSRAGRTWEVVDFLSQAWIDRLPGTGGSRGGAPGDHDGPADGDAPSASDLDAKGGRNAPDGDETEHTVVIRQVVTDVPGAGEVGYDVVIVGDRVGARRQAGTADVTCRSDYVTASSVAAGTLPIHAALAAGRVKVAGNVGAMAEVASLVAGRDPLPPGLRAETEFPAAQPASEMDAEVLPGRPDGPEGSER
jgi:hypothetical protein